MKSVELFSGAGGLGMGLAKAGFEHKAVIELNKHACRTIRENQRRGFSLVKHWNVIEEDITSFNFDRIRDSIDVVSGGPPCQPFSLAGKHRGFNDNRDMFPHATRAITELKPKAFIFENVKGLLRQSFAEYFEYIILRLTYPELIKKSNEQWEEHLRRLEICHTKGTYDGLKYNVVFRLLNSANYGIPQTRERVFIVGFRSDLHSGWAFPRITHTKEALLWKQWVTGEYWEEHNIQESERPKMNSRLKDIVRKIQMNYSIFPPDEKRWMTVRDVLADLPPPYKSNKNNILTNHHYKSGAKIYPGHTGSPLDEPAKTLKAGDHGVPGGENMIRYPNEQVRYFTVRESARIQTFADDYIFEGSWGESMRQIGNAVPVKLAEIIGNSLLQHIENSVGDK